MGKSKLLTGWLKEHVQTGSAHAERIASLLYRWVVQSSSLHSPALARRLKSLINRTLHLLVTNLHSYGCQVLHVDNGMVLLKTTRYELSAAYALLDWIGRELKTIDAFSWLDFTPVKYWKLLAWMDSSNYHGLVYELPSDMKAEMTKEQTETLMKWSISEYLPPAIQPIFKKVIQEYVWRASLQLVNAQETSRGEPEPSQSVSRTTLIPNANDVRDIDEEIEEDTKMDSEFAQLFLRVLREAQKYFFSTNLASEEDTIARCFPVLLGSRLVQSHGSHHPAPRAALTEFVKMCGAVFTLDTENPRQGEHLLKLAYGLLGVREFADEVIWKKPVATFLLKDVICSVCMGNCDLDICRDLGVGQPVCPTCSNSFDLSVIESSLLTQLSKYLRSYLQQDFACSGCPTGMGIKVSAMQLYCHRCAKPYALTTPNPSEISELVDILRLLAPRLGMRALSCFIEGIPL